MKGQRTCNEGQKRNRWNVQKWEGQKLDKTGRDNQRRKEEEQKNVYLPVYVRRSRAKQLLIDLPSIQSF